MTEAYPLAWPDGWPRTPHARMRDGRSDFGKVDTSGRYSWKSKRALTFAEARDSLLKAATKVGAVDVVLSTSFVLNRSGLPSDNRRRPDDQGVALYFNLGGRALVMARDAYQRAEENMRSLALALEALAQLERHGGGVMLEKAFAGFAALPAPKKWWQVLGVEPTASADDVAAAFRRLSKTAHPDNGGSHDEMAQLTEARAAALKALEGPK